MAKTNTATAPAEGSAPAAGVTEVNTEAGSIVEMLPVKFKALDERAKLPAYAKAGDAGLDIYGIEQDTETDTYIQYRTGLAVEIPAGYVGLIFARSSVSKFDLILANCVAVIDSGYRGEILLRFKKIARFKQLLNWFKGLLSNGVGSELGCKTFDLTDPIAQMIILPYPTIAAAWADELSDTERGAGSFGHTNETK